MRIVLVTDSHLGPQAGPCNENWLAVRRFIERSNADLTIHLGDITVDAANNAHELGYARDLCRDWPTPIRFLPGNHDIGDNPPGPDVPSKEPLDLARLVEYRAVFGADYWSIETEGGRLIGLNAQLLGSATAAEDAQWHWLEREVTALQAGAPIVLLLHKPMFQEGPDDDTPHIRYVPLAPRRRLFALLRHAAVRLVLSGHVHQYLDRTIGWRHVWLPSTGFYIPEPRQERIGEKVVGLGVLELTRDLCRLDLVCPDGVRRHCGTDMPLYPNKASKPRTA